MLWALGWRTTDEGASPLPANTNRPNSTPITAATTRAATKGRRSRRGPAGRAPPTAPTAAAVLRANAVVGVVVPLPRRGLVGEGGQERLVVGVDAVTQQVVGRLVELRGERGGPGQSTQLDVGDVVGQAPAVREPGGVTAEHAERARVGR